MKIEKITVRAGRTVPHPLHSYGNIKTDLEIVAALDGGDDAETVRRQLQAKVENDVENHLAELRESIADMEEAHDRKRKMRRLETQLADTTAALDALKAAVENDADRPLLRPRYAGPKTAGETDPHEFPPLCDGTP